MDYMKMRPYTGSYDPFWLCLVCIHFLYSNLILIFCFQLIFFSLKKKKTHLFFVWCQFSATIFPNFFFLTNPIDAYHKGSFLQLLCFMNVLLHSYHVLGIVSDYMSFESLGCSLPTWFWVITVHHHIWLPIPLNTSVLLMIFWYWPGSCFCDWVKSPCFTFLYLNLIKLMCVPCGIAFGSLLCVCSLAEDLSFP